MTYEKYIHNFTFQEGNVAAIDFTMDTSFSMAGVAVSLQVRDTAGRLIIEKNSANNTITLTGQRVYITIDSADTKRRSGKHQYEIDFLNSFGKPYATIGGDFIINSEINRT
jgi:hypothetical protein